MAVFAYQNTGTNQVVYVGTPSFDGNPLWQRISGEGGGGGDVDAHAAAVANVHGIPNTSVLETQAGAVAKVAAHVGATDPHGDRAAAAAALSGHVASSDPHGDRAAIDAKIATHAGAADPHGDRAFATTSIAGHSVASDPHGDRAAAASAIVTHAAASDPHGDRAAAAAAIAVHAGNSDPHGDRAFASSSIATHAAANDPHGDRAFASSTLSAKVDKATLTTKGDLYAASAAATPVRVAVGTAGQALTPDSTAAAGVKWGQTDSPSVINAVARGAAITQDVDQTTLFTALLAGSTTLYPRPIYFPTGDYRVVHKLLLPAGTTLSGNGPTATRFWPDTGLAEPVFDLGSNVSRVSDLSIDLGGLAGVPAVIMGGQMQELSNVEIRQWKGRGVDVGVDVAHQNFSMLRRVNVASVIQDGYNVRTTYTLLEGCVANSCGGNGFVLGTSPFFGYGGGSLVGCVSEFNAGHGFLVTGGSWDLQVYGENNAGDLIHVDGTLQYDTQVTLTAGASAGATSIAVGALAKGLPEWAVLRFADGTLAVVNSDTAGPTVNLKSALANAQVLGAVATLAPEDIPRSKLPTVIIRGGAHDGPIWLHACNYRFDPLYQPVSGSVTISQSAHMIDGNALLRHKNNAITFSSGGGSRALGAALGWTRPIVPNGLVHAANPNYEHRLLPSGAVNLLPFPAHWDPKLRIPRGQVVAAASIVSPKY